MSDRLDREIENDDLRTAWEDLPTELAERRQKVADQRRRRIPVAADCSISLGVDPRTVKRDLAWLRTQFQRYVEIYDPPEWIGETLSLYREIESRCLIAAEEALVSREKPAQIPDRKGNLRWKMVQASPDHQAANRHFLAALHARERQTVLLKDLGLIKTIPTRIEIGGTIDVTKLSGEQLEEVNARLSARIADIEAQIARIEAGNSLEEPDP